MSLKCYSYWHLGAIKNDLTTLTLRFTEDSAKQLVIKHIIYCDLYDWTALIGECILCFACTFRDVNTNDGILNLGESYFNKKIGRNV